jgi:polysaccharide export outer membrane protein
MFGNPGSHTIPNGPVAEYRLSPGDEIDITFVNTPEFNSHQIIRADGAISLTGLKPPAPAELIAANLSIRELNRYLIDAYSIELRNPQISVSLKAYGANVVYVMGEVGRPGAVPFAGFSPVEPAFGLLGLPSVMPALRSSDATCVDGTAPFVSHSCTR